MPLVSHSNWNSHPSLYTTGMFSGALTKILCPHVQKVVAGCPVGLSLGFFSVPLCNQAVFWVTYQEDCTTVHWLIVQYSFWQLVVREEGCQLALGIDEYANTKPPCRKTFLEAEIDRLKRSINFTSREVVQVSGSTGIDCNTNIYFENV